MLCPQGQGGLSQCGHFAEKGGGDLCFAILCGRLLWTALNVNDGQFRLNWRSLTKPQACCFYLV